MSEIQDRLKTTSEECLKCYEAWSKDDKDAKVRESLQDAIHELRKVASRLEIELAISERDQMAQKPIAIPAHRNSKGRGSDDQGNAILDDNKKSDGPDVEKKPKPRRRTPRQSGTMSAPKAKEG